MVENPRNDIATLGKLLTLEPAPVAATWSIARIGDDAVPGPSDTILWAVLQYTDADFVAVVRQVDTTATSPSATPGEPPAWLLKDTDLARFRRGSSYVVESHPFGRFSSSAYPDGRATVLSGHRILIYAVSR